MAFLNWQKSICQPFACRAQDFSLLTLARRPPLLRSAKYFIFPAAPVLTLLHASHRAHVSEHAACLGHGSIPPLRTAVTLHEISGRTAKIAVTAASAALGYRASTLGVHQSVRSSKVASAAYLGSSKLRVPLLRVRRTLSRYLLSNSRP